MWVRASTQILTIGCMLPALLSAQRVVPIRELSPAEAVSQEGFKSILGVRPLADGSLLVNDGVRRQLVVLDKNLVLKSILLDSAATNGHSYGPAAAPIIPYLADSTLFVDGAARALLVIDPRGNIARVTSPPIGRDFGILAYTSSAVDGMGNLIYRGFNTSARGPVDPGHPSPLPAFPDSAPILRANFDTRIVDTIGRVREKFTVSTNSVQQNNGMMLVTKIINPVTIIDEWAVLSDGSVAFIRGHDYHIDWLMNDGQRRSSEKLPFDWKKLTDDDKLVLVDSARKAEEKLIADAKAAKKAKADAGGSEVEDRVAKSLDPILQFVPLGEMSDYYPAIRSGAAKPDLDSSLWILPTTSAQSKQGELVYDVVNNRGVLTHRVRIPLNRSIAGFGHNGIVYLMYRDHEKIWHLERTRVVQ